MISIRTPLLALLLLLSSCSDVDALTARLGDDTVDCGTPALEDCAEMLACLQPAIASDCATTAHVRYVSSSDEGGVTNSDWFLLPAADGACELHLVTENEPSLYDRLGSGSHVRCPSFALHPADATACRAPASLDDDVCEIVSN